MGPLSTIASAKRFASLPRSDQRLVLEAAIWLVSIACGLRILPYPALRNLLDRLAHPRRTSGVPLGDHASVAARVSWAITAAARVPFLRTCLVQAMSAEVMLRRRSVDARFQVGAKRPQAGEPLEAHAWIELDGQTVVGHLPNHAEYFALSHHGRGGRA